MFSPRDLTVQQLRCFVTVADEGQFTAAADELQMAQPSISAQIARLETVLGVSLFVRGRRPISLTEAGRELLPIARRALTTVEDVFHAVDELDGLRRGHVTIGATPSIGATLVPRALASFRAAHPEVSLALVERDTDTLASDLVAGRLDLALVVGPFVRTHADVTTLATERLALLMREDHPLAHRAEVRIGDLRDVPLIMFHEGYELRTATLQAFADAGFEPLVAMDGAEVATVHAFVAAGLGAAIVPSILATMDDSLTLVHLAEPVIERTICLVRDSRHPLTRAARVLREVIEAEITTAWPPGAGIVLAPSAVPPPAATTRGRKSSQVTA